MNRQGFFIEPTIFSEVTDEMEIAMEEIFGPVMCILRFKDLDEVIQRANSTRYGLAGGVMTQSLKSAMEVQKKLKCGIVYVNCWG